jgi:hypothetical protein
MSDIEADDLWALRDRIDELNLHLRTLIRILQRLEE